MRKLLNERQFFLITFDNFVSHQKEVCDYHCGLRFDV